jgi:hypothetical protein
MPAKLALQGDTVTNWHVGTKNLKSNQNNARRTKNAPSDRPAKDGQPYLETLLI